MNEKGTGVLEKYNIKVLRTGRARGAVICETDSGLKLLKEITGSLQRVLFEDELLNMVRNSGYYFVDCYVRNKEAELCTTDIDGVKYVLKDWYSGHECDVTSKNELYASSRSLAALHKIMNSTDLQSKDILKEFSPDSLIVEYDKHNRELKRVRSFMRDKRRKTEFELGVLQCYDTFYGLGEKAYELLLNSPYQKLMQKAGKSCSICHGNYNYHNIIFHNEGVAVTNFEHAEMNLQVVDLYHFLRKVMEKHNWDMEIGYCILEEYDKVKTLSSEEMEILYILLLYPEKFWKIANYYYNSNKAWIPQRNMDKLQIICRQNDLKNMFLRNIFSR